MAREMTPAATLGTYAVALALVFSAALVVGRAVGPASSSDAGQRSTTHDQGSHDTTGQER